MGPTPPALAVLSNDEVIAIDQDPLGKQGRKVLRGTTEVWAKNLAGGDTAAMLLNRRDAPARIECSFAALGFEPGAAVTVRDLWAAADIGVLTDAYTTEVPSHGVVLLRLAAPP